VKFGAACRAILAGYRRALKQGGVPFVLDERFLALRALAQGEDRSPARFWKKLTAVLSGPAVEPPPAVREALIAALPVPDLQPWFRFRGQVGLGSLGRPRYLALAEWAGGWLAREAKASAPPATAWAAGRSGAASFAAAAVRRAIRCPDPFYRVDPGWVVRRLGPRCSRIELDHLARARDLDRVLRAMGAETANVHLGTPDVAAAIRADLARRPDGWLEGLARELFERVERDWNRWRKVYRRGGKK